MNVLCTLIVVFVFVMVGTLLLPIIIPILTFEISLLFMAGFFNLVVANFYHCRFRQNYRPRKAGLDIGNYLPVMVCLDLLFPVGANQAKEKSPI